MTLPAFKGIHEAALMRHGAALDQRLILPKSRDELAAMPANRYLSAMSLRIFRAGLKYSVVDAKWPAFEEVFQGFQPTVVARLYDEDIEAMLGNTSLIRHLGKLRAVRDNAKAMVELGDFPGYISDWPGTDIVGLWADLAKRMRQLGGNSAPMFLRMVGKDTFIFSDAVVRALNHFAVFDGTPKSKSDKAVLQDAFNGWAAETKRPLCQLSQILAMSVD